MSRRTFNQIRDRFRSRTQSERAEREAREMRETQLEINRQAARIRSTQAQMARPSPWWVDYARFEPSFTANLPLATPTSWQGGEIIVPLQMPQVTEMRAEEGEPVAERQVWATLGGPLTFSAPTGAINAEEGRIINALPQDALRSMYVTDTASSWGIFKRRESDLSTYLWNPSPNNWAPPETSDQNDARFKKLYPLMLQAAAHQIDFETFVPPDHENEKWEHLAQYILSNGAPPEEALRELTRDDPPYCYPNFHWYDPWSSVPWRHIRARLPMDIVLRLMEVAVIAVRYTELVRTSADYDPSFQMFKRLCDLMDREEVPKKFLAAILDRAIKIAQSAKRDHWIWKFVFSDYVSSEVQAQFDRARDEAVSQFEKKMEESLTAFFERKSA